MAPRVLLDTNALMMPVECDVRVFDELERLVGECEFVVPEAVDEELERLAGGHGTEAVAASVGADLLDERCRVRPHEASSADDAVVELATAGDVEYVVTNDAPLRERLRDRGVPVIGLRGRNKLAITQT